MYINFKELQKIIRQRGIEYLTAIPLLPYIFYIFSLF